MLFEDWWDLIAKNENCFSDSMKVEGKKKAIINGKLKGLTTLFN